MIDLVKKRKRRNNYSRRYGEDYEILREKREPKKKPNICDTNIDGA